MVKCSMAKCGTAKCGRTAKFAATAWQTEWPDRPATSAGFLPAFPVRNRQLMPACCVAVEVRLE
jgi:hypothetical protein